MKKLILMAAGLTMFFGCSKSVNTPTPNADMQTTAKPAAYTADSDPVKAIARVVFTRPGPQGGYGWVLYMGKDDFEVPANLPEQYQKENIYVAVTYYQTDKQVPRTSDVQVPKNYIYLTEISEYKLHTNTGD